MQKFKLQSKYKPIEEQKRAVSALTENIVSNIPYQVLLGVTGSGKTFTIANVIEKLQRPTLIISHNKTLAGQLYQEFRDYFPENAVSYFVSYYDYYQPEAYIPSTDTYIEKDADINDLIDKLRLSATTNLLTRPDTIVVASVSAIYNLGSPKDYKNFILEIKIGTEIDRKDFLDKLVNLQYSREDYGFHRGTFRVRGDVIDIYPAYQDESIRITFENNKIAGLKLINSVSGEELKDKKRLGETFTLYPAKHYITDPIKNKDSMAEIERDVKIRANELEKNGKPLEALRLKQRVTYDLSMIRELGYVKGIENYSRYFDGRKIGEAPNSLLEYFNVPYGKDWLLVVDESHMTFPQIRGMYNGDFSRKQTLIDYGFRLPSALDNRPLKFEEFMKKIPNFIATSATPSVWELSMAKEASAKNLKKSKYSKDGISEQLVRPTGIPDPKVEIQPVASQVQHVTGEILKEKEKGRRTLITTLTKKSAEDLSQYLKDKGLLVSYLHSDIDTLERTDILDDLRSGKYDALVGVNLLREGLDLPEVSLVAIFDADKEGFLRSEVSLIQTMGRAARNVDSHVIMYADKVTDSMRKAIEEVERRRKYQLYYNKKHHIIPRSIQKPIREKIAVETEENFFEMLSDKNIEIKNLDMGSLTPYDRKKLIGRLRQDMKIAATDLNFELAAQIRDKIKLYQS